MNSLKKKMKFIKNKHFEDTKRTAFFLKGLFNDENISKSLEEVEEENKIFFEKFEKQILLNSEKQKDYYKKISDSNFNTEDFIKALLEK